MSGRGYFGVALHRPKTPANVGSALRAVGVYGGAFLTTSGNRFPPGVTDTMKAYRHAPYFRVGDAFDYMPYDCVPVAVELVEGAQSLVEYKHPERAVYIFGQEDGTLGKKILGRCRDVVYVPTSGCMNLAACVNVVLYDRMAKGEKR